MRPLVVLALSRWIGPIAAWLVPTYPVMLAFGSALAAVWAVEATSARGYRRSDAIGVFAVGYAGGLVGSLIVPAVQGLVVWIETKQFLPPTGMAAYGGMIGGTIGSIVALRKQRLAVLPFLDAAVPAVFLGYFFARIGCLLAGCDYGRVSPVAWAVRFPAASPAFRDHLAHGLLAPGAARSLGVHPTQIYSSLVGLSLFVIGTRLPTDVPGRRFALVVVLYAIARASIELVRGDASRGHVGPLSTSQALGAVTVLAVLPLLVGMRRKAASEPAAAR